MEHDPDSTNPANLTGVTRGQNQLHFVPEDWAAAARVIEPLLGRLAADAENPQLLIVANDVDAAAGVAHEVTTRSTAIRVLAATDARRAARVLRSAAPHVVSGPPLVLEQLLQSAALKLDTVRLVVLAWVDDLDGSSTRALEALMSALPKSAARVALAESATPAVAQLVERYAWRARRMQAVSEDAAPVSLSYVTVADSARPEAVRRILDAVDPDSATIIVHRTDARAAVETLLRSLGYGAESSAVRVADAPNAEAKLAVLYELPTSPGELRALVRSAAAAQHIALVTPRQVAALRRFAGGDVKPFVVPTAADRARTREEAVREELRGVLAAGQYSRELLALEPLLAEHDGSEIAAAALRLLESERAKARSASAPPAPTAAAMTRLYVNVGETDNVRAGDLVGAIMHEAGISKSEVGRVDVRDRHSTVEVATAVAEAVVAKLTGVSIKGRRAIVKVDDAPTRGGGPRRRERPERERPRRNPR